ncbi:ATP-binding protein [Chryseobacterium culicis]|uniref:histidine kinase n=1 Tax=Chryseobacterium culicis TaxID=680127 RepID=A0A2S9CRF8_CHRCI|nr:ATP-binding protein [Chryseobacterium culicis]PRB83067.1 histidine kinase [Chryseobacterium culicis]PRB89308.1 histidine kinase [Chryseobacterium culicis]
MKKLFFLLTILSFLYSCKKENSQNDTNQFYEKAYTFLEKKNEDSAYVYFDKAKEVFLKNENKIKEGKCLIQMAIISTNKGDYYNGQSLSTRAIKNFDENDKNQFSDIYSNYINLGISSDNLRDYKNAIKFSKLALKFAVDESSKLIALNNLSRIYKENKQYTQAIKIYKNIISRSKTQNNQIYPTALTNLTTSKWLSDPSYSPEPELLKALKIRENENDLWGQNSSHSHLSNYFMNKNSEKALFHANKMYEISKKIKSPDDQLEALQKIITLDPHSYKKFFNRYTTLADSLQTERNNSKNQFALIKFDTEQIKKQNAQNKNHILTQYIAIGILIVVLVVLTLIIMWYKKRQKGLQQEKEIEVKNTQLKMSKKVHDVVANGLYHMMIDVQNNPEMDKTKILNDIEKMYEESRDISHENIAEKDFALRFINMITSYSSDEQKVLPLGYKENIWESISYNTQLELYYTLREILVNMKKHSQAKLASVRFEKDNNNLKIKYTDNGIGINNLDQQKGTGIHNTENRIESVGGDITFEKNPTGGLIVQITIPIQSKYV